MRNRFFIILLSTTFISCNFSAENEIDVSAVDVAFSVSRFDIDFYATTPATLTETKQLYPHFFPEGVPDSIWIQKLQNTDERELLNETQKVFTSFENEEKQLTTLFKYIKFYSPQFVVPEVTTLISNIDYESKVIYINDQLLISLDVYLGKEHPFYSNFPKYIKQNYHKEHLIVDVANAIIDTQVQIFSDRTFLSKMIQAGKRLYLLDIYLPVLTDEEKIGFEKIKLDWAIANESEIWKYFIENKLLYSTETKLNNRFIEDAPFSKFYRSQDNLSPGRIGTWFGWQIVRSYMKHNNASMADLLEANTEELFKKSKYKPKK